MYEGVVKERLVDIVGSMEMMVQNDGAEVNVDLVRNFDGFGAGTNEEDMKGTVGGKTGSVEMDAAIRVEGCGTVED